MHTTSDVEGQGAARSTEEAEVSRKQQHEGLEDSWFQWPRLTSTPPARPSVAPPLSLADDLADAWFR
jgi:hypothetical protein